MKINKIIIMNELKNMLKTWYILVLGLIIIILLFSIKRDNDKVKPVEKKAKAVSIKYTYNKEAIHKDEYVSDVYAGRTDKVKNAEYNSLGLPKDRYWMTSGEWHGKHIKNMPINNAKKKLLLTRFKTWKQLHIKSFIDEMLKSAVKEHETFSEIPPSLIVAQAIIETNFGLSKLAVVGNNYFGHKYRGSNPLAYIVAADDSPTDRFTKYKSTWFSLRHHTRNVLMRLYYPRCKGKSDLDSWLNALCGAINAKESKKFVDAGNYVYATSCMTEVCYAQKLKNIIEAFNLDIFDELL
tara:strand:+ start:8404 stop:9288 length:885 start_codon:yes stop_codon:yes gene_type:complete